MKTRIEQFENHLMSIKDECTQINGQLSFIKDSIKEKEDNIESLKHQREVVSKAVELLQFVEKATRVQTQKIFETIVSDAMRYVFNEDYKLELEFDRRGNLPTLKFNIKTPGCEEYLDINETESGGVTNICSLALRLVLIQLITPTIEGPLIFDEKWLGVAEENRNNVIRFLYEVNKRLKRQLILVSHCSETINNADNIIKIGD